MQTFFLYFGLVGLALTLPPLFAIGLWRMDSHPVLEAVSRIRRHPIAVQLFLAAFVLHLIVHGSIKTNANGYVEGGVTNGSGGAEGGVTNGPSGLPPPGMPPPLALPMAGGDPTVYGFTSNQLAVGFVLSRVDAAGSCAFAPPSGASVVEAWRLRGAQLCGERRVTAAKHALARLATEDRKSVV